MTTVKKLPALALSMLLAAPLGGHAAPAAGALPPLFQVTLLPTELNGANSMNQAGHVVGSGMTSVWLWTEAGSRQLAAVNTGYSDGLGINSRDDVAGTSYGNAGGIAFANIGGAVQDIGAAAPDFRSSFARRINDNGWVVGALYDGRGIESRPFIYRNGSVQVLPTLGGNAGSAFAVSNRGHVTGQAALPTTQPFSGGGNAFLYFGGTMTGLGALPGDDSSSGLDVNERGDVVGVSSQASQGGSRGFLFSRGRMVNLGSLGGSFTDALAINNAGVVVGRSYTAGNAAERGFIYAYGRMIDLNRLVRSSGGRVITAGLDINDAFQILVRACSVDGTDCRSLRLEPPSGPGRHRLQSWLREMAAGAGAR